MKREIVDSLQRLSRQMQRYSAKTSPNSFGRARGRVLRAISENDGIIAKDLAALLDIRPPSLTDKLDKLEEDGNVVRIREHTDMRIVRIYITDKGRETIMNSAKGRDVAKKVFSDCLTQEESELFCELCERMSNSLEELIKEETGKTDLIIAKPICNFD